LEKEKSESSSCCSVTLTWRRRSAQFKTTTTKAPSGRRKAVEWSVSLWQRPYSGQPLQSASSVGWSFLDEVRWTRREPGVMNLERWPM